MIEIYKTLQSVKSVVLKYAMENELFWILIEWKISNLFSQFTVFKILKTGGSYIKQKNQITVFILEKN